MTLNPNGALSKVLVGIATAAALAGATSLIRAAEKNAVQDVRIERIERVADRMEALDKNLAQTQTEVALLRKELEKRP